MFRAAGKRLLWAGKIRRRTFFSERELFLFRDQTFFSRSDSCLTERSEVRQSRSRKRKVWSRKRKSSLEEKKEPERFSSESTRFYSSTDTFFLPLKLHDLNHKSIKCIIWTFMDAPLVQTSFMDATSTWGFKFMHLWMAPWSDVIYG